MANVVSLSPSPPEGGEEWCGTIISYSEARGGYDHEVDVRPTGRVNTQCSYRFVFYTPGDQRFEVGTKITLRVPPEAGRFDEHQVFELVVKAQTLENGFKVHRKVLRLGPNGRTYLYKYTK